MEHLSEMLLVLLEQEGTTYATRDYHAHRSSEAVLFDLETRRPSENSDDEIDSGDSNLYTDSSSPPGSKKRKMRQQNLSEVYALESRNDIYLRIQWREKLCEWAYRVVDYLRLSREIVCIAMNTFDRYRAVLHGSRQQQGVPFLRFVKEDYTLSLITCLSMAIKLYEYRRILVPGSRSTMETILKLCGNTVSIEQVEAKEYDILTNLHWRVHPPTPQLFLEFIFMVSEYRESTVWNEVKDLALYLIELSTMDYYFISFRASEIALAALLNATDTMNTQSNQVDFALLSAIGLTRTVRIAQCQTRLAALYAKSSDSSFPSNETIPRMQSPVSVTADLQD